MYALGTSNGGAYGPYDWRRIYLKKLTAFGAIVAANPVNSNCQNSKVPISALYMNGTADPILPYDGGQMASNRGEVFSAEKNDTILGKKENKNGFDSKNHYQGNFRQIQG